MRFLWALSLCVVSVACGQRGQRFTVEDGAPRPTTNAIGSSDKQNAAVHSLMGWLEQIPYTIDASFDQDQRQAIQNAAATWNEAVGREVLRYAGIHAGSHGSSLYDSLEDTETVIYFEPTWLRTTGKQASTLATTVWENSASDNNVIARGDVILNGEFYVFADATVASEPDDGRALADVESVVLHELGHLLGLNHVAPEVDSESVMLAYAMIGENVYHRQLSGQDIENIRSIYNK